MEELNNSSSQNEAPAVRCAEQYVTFAVGKLTFGVDIGAVREILRSQPLTEVPLAPTIVRGIINLRGQVLTAIDMRKLLSLPEFAPDARPTNIIVKADDEFISLLVDSIGDVIQVDPQTFEDVPSTLPHHVGALLQGVIKREGKLLLAFNPSACLSCEGA